MMTAYLLFALAIIAMLFTFTGVRCLLKDEHTNIGSTLIVLGIITYAFMVYGCYTLC